LCLYTSPYQATKAAEILRACKLERFEDTAPMNNQPSNGNFWDDMQKWLELRTPDEPRGESAMNGWGSGSTEKPDDACKSTPETESKCMAIRIAGEI
jgi:hypothetical protein